MSVVAFPERERQAPPPSDLDRRSGVVLQFTSRLELCTICGQAHRASKCPQRPREDARDDEYR